ncbi:MAG: DNA polymerase III subunit delta [Bacteroidota bacterium]
MYFKTIPEHQHIKQRLVHLATRGQVPHAYLFWGAAGSAQLALALAVATYLHCQYRLPEDACGQCRSCLKMQKGIHPDTQFLFPMATAQQTPKETPSADLAGAWRSFLQTHAYGHLQDWMLHAGSTAKQPLILTEQARQVHPYLSLTPVESSYKIVLIWLPEHLHLTAANTLLKVLEEPPKQTLFLLVSVAPDKILTTIRSRAHALYVPIFSDASVASLLQQQYSDLSAPQINTLVALADGDVGTAFRLANDEGSDALEAFVTWMRMCYKQDVTHLVARAEAYQQLTREKQKHFFLYALHMLRCVLITWFGHETLHRATPAELDFNRRFSTSLTYPQVKSYASWFQASYNYLDRNVNPRILFLDVSLRVSRAFQPDI